MNSVEVLLNLLAIEPVSTSLALMWAGRLLLATIVGVAIFVAFLSIMTVVNWIRGEIPVKKGNMTCETVTRELENGKFGVVTNIFNSGTKTGERVWEADDIEDGLDDIDMDYV